MPIVYAQEGNADAASVQRGIVEARARLMTAAEGIGQGTDEETVLNALSVVEEVCAFLNALSNEADDLLKTSVNSVRLIESLSEQVDDYVREQLDKDSSFLKQYGLEERDEQERFCRRAVVNAAILYAGDDCGLFDSKLKKLVNTHSNCAEASRNATLKKAMTTGGKS